MATPITAGAIGLKIIDVIRFATQTTQNNPIQIRERPKPARKPNPRGGK